MIVEGTVAFSNLTQHEEYQGRSTGKFSLTLALTQESAEALSGEGVKLKDYKGTPQRKFTSQFPVKAMDVEKNPFKGEIPWGSKVRLSVQFGKPSPVHGVTPYLKAVKVLEVNEGFDDEEDEL